MIDKDLMAIPGRDKISIIDTNKYQLIRTINVLNSGNIYGICMLNKNILLTGDSSKTIRQWRIERDNLIIISIKENAHDGEINALLNIGNGHFLSGSDDCRIKICILFFIFIY